MTIALIVLALVVLALMAERHLDRRAWTAERRHLVAIIAARTPREVAQIEQPRPPKPAKDPDERPKFLVGT